jgi:hypothetical protein
MMNHNRRIFRLAATASAVLFAAAVAFAQGNEHAQMQGQAQGKEQVIKVGKKGEIVFSETTQIGDVTLKPGHYLFQHRAAGDEHFVKFTELFMSQDRHAGGATTGAKDAGEIKCNVEPLKEKVNQTAVYSETVGGVKRITRITVAGENVAHVF